MPKITAFAILRFLMRTARITAGFFLIVLIFTEGIDKAGELWSTGRQDDSFLFGLLLFGGFMLALHIAFGEGDPEGWHMQHFSVPEQENWVPSSPQSVKIGRAIGRFVAKVLKS